MVLLRVERRWGGQGRREGHQTPTRSSCCSCRNPQLLLCSLLTGAPSKLVISQDCLWDYSMHSTGAAATLDGLRRTLKAGRRPPLSPALFRDTMRDRLADGSLRFTNEADGETVCALYERGFVAAFDSYCALKREDNVVYYQGLGWGSEDARVLKVALAYAKTHCSFKSGAIQVNLTDNDFLEADEAVLLEAVDGCEAVNIWF